ncbi:MAG: HD domain-containing protein [Bacteroidia bacterium]|nr:HD domain-containing protein [Bacteroidia bacterium]
MTAVQNLKRFWNEQTDVKSLCLCLTGSVARSEATACSDTDILLLMEEGREDPEEYAHVARDLQSVIGRSSIVFRSVDQLADLLIQDMRSWLALTDSRFVAGSRELYVRLWDALAKQCQHSYPVIFEKLKVLTLDRHALYGASTSLLEPNVKSSAGALRDVLAITYLEVIHLLRNADTAVTGISDWAALISNASLLPERRKAVLEARSFFLLVRRNLHEVTGHLNDTLKFELQPHVANATTRDTSGKDVAMVEQFMRRYYQHARNVHLALELSFYDHEATPVHFPETEDHTVIHLPVHGFSHGKEILNMFLMSAQNGGRPGSDVIRALTGERRYDYSGTACGQIFDEILRGDLRVGSTLRSMHEWGVLKMVFPEFATVEFFFQHNIYHYFTLDEHIITMIEKAEALGNDTSVFGDVYRSLRDISVLFYAVLLHDIAKPVDLVRHEIVGATMVPEILRRFGREDAAGDVAFLVRWHLAMEQMAFRRDIRDEAALMSFLDLVQTQERLDFLLLLTYADMAALNPGVLTDWKKVMLLELYHAASARLRGGSEEDGEVEGVRVGEQTEPTASESLLRRAMEDVREGEPVRIFVFQHQAYTEIHVICLDRPLLLTQLSAALLGADVNVIDATIDTRNDIAVDIFRVTDIVRNGCLDQAGIMRARETLRHVCTAEVTGEELFQQFRRKWIRRIRRTVRDSVKTDIAYLDTGDGKFGDRTIIEVYAPDAFGLLYILCREISSFGLNIVFAKIATRVDGVVDSFYVLEASGHPFTDPLRREQLRQSLLRHIKDVSHME